MSSASVVILGAGPAGLGAAYKLAQRGRFRVTVVERNPAVGGNAGSFEVGGMRVDFGSHRLHPSCSPEILRDIAQMLGDDLLDRPRHGRIRLRGRWVHFPLKPLDLASNLPLSFSLGVARDAVFKARPNGEESFASVLQQGLGRTICRDFYFPYARKIWGEEPEALDAEQARRRVSASSISKMMRKMMSAVTGKKGGGRFYYPRRGFGQISDAYHEAARREGAEVLLDTAVTGIALENGRARSVRVRGPEGDAELAADMVLSTIPAPLLVRAINPEAPVSVQAAACGLRFRAMILAYLVLETEQFTEYDAHYFPGREVAITRLSEPKNYGLAALPGRTVLCAELPCSTEEPVWRATDAEIGRLVAEALAAANLPIKVPIGAVATRRIRQAYPIYERGWRQHFETVDRWLGGIEGLLSLGRQGLFAHDNTHHTLAMAYAAVDCLNETAELDRERWADHRREFESHVVED